MTYHGYIQNGQIIFSEPVALPEGAEVRVDVLDGKIADANRAESEKTLYERLKPVIGAAKGLPPDLATQHDHYLHGRPKQ